MNNGKQPLISVLMSVYNGHKYLGETIDSILIQTLADFEFILIDDGSSDGALEIMKSKQAGDQRIRLIQNEKNIGLAASLNRGIEIAKGKYIARMDADDICLPTRFQKQVDYLEKHPEIWILGCGNYHIDDKGNILNVGSFFDNPLKLRWNMIFGKDGVVLHPCVMMVTDKIKQYGAYKLTQASQDLELFSRFFDFMPLPITNLQEPLVKCRWHENSFSVKHAQLQHQVSNEIRFNTLNKAFDKKYSIQTVEAFRLLNYHDQNYSKEQLLLLIKDWFQIWKAFQTKFNVSDAEMEPMYEQLFYRIKNLVSIFPPSKTDLNTIWLGKILPFMNVKIALQFVKYKHDLKKINK